MIRRILIPDSQTLFRKGVKWMVQRTHDAEKPARYPQTNSAPKEERRMASFSDGPVMKQITLLLIQADRLVKEGQLSTALEKIIAARNIDPAHLYAIAYEERVKALLQSRKRSNNAEGGAPPAPPVSPIMPVRHDSEKHAVQETLGMAKRNGSKPAEQGPAAVVSMTVMSAVPEKQPAREDRVVEKEIAALLMSAQHYSERKEFNRALDEIARIYLLVPAHVQAGALEMNIRRAISQQNETAAHPHGYHDARPLPVQRGTGAGNDGMRDEPQKAQTPVVEYRSEAEAARNGSAILSHSRSEKIVACFRRVNELLRFGKLEEALNELALAVIIDPFNEEVLRLEKTIIDAQHRQLEERRRCCNEIAEMIV